MSSSDVGCKFHSSDAILPRTSDESSADNNDDDDDDDNGNATHNSPHQRCRAC